MATDVFGNQVVDQEQPSVQTIGGRDVFGNVTTNQSVDTTTNGINTTQPSSVESQEARPIIQLSAPPQKSKLGVFTGQPIISKTEIDLDHPQKPLDDLTQLSVYAQSHTDLPKYQTISSAIEMQRHLPDTVLPMKKQLSVQELDSLKPDQLVAYNNKLYQQVSKSADILTGNVNLFSDDVNKYGVIGQLAKERLLSQASDYVKENPQGSTQSFLTRAMISQSKLMGTVVNKVKEDFGGDSNLVQQNTQNAIESVRSSEHPYASAFGSAGGKLVSPEMIGSMVVGGPAAGASPFINYLRAVGTFSAEQTGEQAVSGENITPLRNLATNAALFKAAEAGGPIAESLAGKKGLTAAVERFAARAVPAAGANIGATVVGNKLEGRDTTLPDALASGLVGAVPALMAREAPGGPQGLLPSEAAKINANAQEVGLNRAETNRTPQQIMNPQDKAAAIDLMANQVKRLLGQQTTDDVKQAAAGQLNAASERPKTPMPEAQLAAEAKPNVFGFKGDMSVKVNPLDPVFDPTKQMPLNPPSTIAPAKVVKQPISPSRVKSIPLVGPLPIWPVLYG